uniref:Bromo domain-containing protein n=1 Tax=Globodera pallida TaxID=36090 RepID=A0A183CDT6_GLOPA
MGLQHRQSGKRTMRTNSNGAKKSSTETAEKGIKDAAATKYRGEKLLDGIGMNKPQASPLSRRLTPDFLRAAVQDGCELMRCQLICYRVKFDAKCGGSAGALLSEAFVRPISQAQEFLTYGHIAPFMGAFLPHQCDFMVKKEVLNEFRIPPELDDALHRKYNHQKGVEETKAENKHISVSKEKLPQEEDGPSVSPVAEISNNNGAGNADENVEQTVVNVSEADPGDRTKVSHVVGTAA